MAFRKNELMYLVEVDPERARAKILKAFKKSKGNATHAADDLAIDLRTLQRYLDRLGMKERIDQYRKRVGFYPGREAVAKRKTEAK